jgi:hypothetical protein
MLARGRLRPLLAALLAAIGAAAAVPAAADAGVVTRVVRYGPLDVGGFRTRMPKLGIPAPGVDGSLTHMDVRLVGRRGRPVGIGRVMLHHVVFLDDGPPGTPARGSCGGRHAQPFYGTGEEHQRLDLPPGYGYPLHRRDRWRMQVMLMSHSVRPAQVYVQWTMRIRTGRRLTPVTPYWLRPNGCAASYTVPGGGPPGSTDRRTATWVVPRDGRIVAAGGHLHAGAEDLTLRDPGCRRELLDARPLFGRPEDPVYAVRPVLHEPGPIATRFFLSRSGLPVRRGQRLRITGTYDGEHPRARVMSIIHLYLAPPRGRPGARCAPLPRDRREVLLRQDGRTDPPYEPVPFNVMDTQGRIGPVDHLPGLPAPLGAQGTVDLAGNRFAPAKVALPVGGVLRWRFRDPEAHNVLFASGPAVVGSATHRRGTTSARFRRPGTYQLFCPLHPITMQQEVVVG